MPHEIDSRTAGRVSCGWRTHRIEGPGVTPRDPKFPFQNLPKRWLDGQRWKIQDHDLPAGSDFDRDIRGGLQSEGHWLRGHLLGEPMMEHPMYILRGWVESRFHTGPLQTIACNGSGNWLVMNISQSNGTPPACVWGHLLDQHAVVPVYVYR